MKYGHFTKNESYINDACEMLDICANKLNQGFYYPTFCSGIGKKGQHEPIISEALYYEV